MASSLNGTGLTFSSGATLNSPPVTSIATGNGLSGGTITTTGTLTIAAPGFNTVGAYAFCIVNSGNITLTSGATYSAGASTGQIGSVSLAQNSCVGGVFPQSNVNNLSGTWRYMGGTQSGLYVPVGLFCRIA